jgi:DNA-binding response OmpR family regulator
MSKILVIDDDEKLSGLIKDFLEPYKYQVVCFSSPEVALSKLKLTKPELIILDTAHVAFDKAAELLNMKLVKVKTDSITCKPWWNELESSITESTF